MADHIVSDGYKDVGYQFINIDVRTNVCITQNPSINEP